MCGYFAYWWKLVDFLDEPAQPCRIAGQNKETNKFFMKSS
jgi:hypothetical protein